MKDNKTSYIEIRNANTNNLKNISLKIPKNKLTVITGLSGCGKSSLAFDTIYAEGQRRYIESLSSYARQFLGRMNKPDVEMISGLSPTIAIQQKVTTSNSRSTVGTSTEIYEYLRMLYARVGHTFSPISGKEVKCHQVGDVVDFIMSLPQNTQVYILSPFIVPDDRTSGDQLSILLQQGFSRLLFNDILIRIEEYLEMNHTPDSSVRILVDRLKVNDSVKDSRARLSESVQTAFYEGHESCIVRYGEGTNWNEEVFSSKFEADGITFEHPDSNMFTFNSPVGACKTCQGFGSIIGIDENLVVPNKTLSVFEDAVLCWRGEKMSEWKDALIRVADKCNFPIYKPYIDLSESEKDFLWNGNEWFEGINRFFKWIETQQYKIQYRVMLSRYRGKTVCPDCKGTRLRKDAQYVKVGDKSLCELVIMPVSELSEWFDNLQLSKNDEAIASKLLIEIRSRLHCLMEVGLGYLTLNRASNSLSGGESQRINIATSIGSSLVGSTYILDEPSIGLHPRDTDQLISVLKRLRDIGNTVIVVEHDEEIIRNADHIIDIGPFAGDAGGRLVFQGDFDKLLKSDTLTAKYINKEKIIPIPDIRRKWNNYIEVEGASENNLKNITVRFPLNTFNVVTGVSGSGKSSLVNKVVYEALKKQLGGAVERSINFKQLSGSVRQIENIEYIDQNPIGKSTRSNPATYIKAYDDIRQLYSEQKLSQMRGLKPSYFSFNTPGGRCETCEGEGRIKIEMQFMSDVYLTCDVCHGSRFKDEALEIKYNSKTISDVLDMSIDEAIDFFGTPGEFRTITERIVNKLNALKEVGLGYLKVGQESSTLSGGEAQRVKLASFLVKGAAEKRTLFIFDEPTTGLHLHDINKLLKALNKLIENGHSLIIIEHNIEVIKSADWIIDLGPEGGEDGGYVVFEGTPEELLKCKESYTAKALKVALSRM